MTAFRFYINRLRWSWCMTFSAENVHSHETVETVVRDKWQLRM